MSRWTFNGSSLLRTIQPEPGGNIMRIHFSNTRTANIAAAMPDFPVQGGYHF